MRACSLPCALATCGRFVETRLREHSHGSGPVAFLTLRAGGYSRAKVAGVYERAVTARAADPAARRTNSRHRSACRSAFFVKATESS